MESENQNKSFGERTEAEENIADVFRDISPMTADSYKKDIRRNKRDGFGFPRYAIFAVIAALLVAIYFLLDSQ